MHLKRYFHSMKTLKALGTPPDSVFDIARHDAVLTDYGRASSFLIQAKTA